MAFDRTKPQNTEKLKDTPALIRANWDAIAAGTDPELLITNAKVSPTAGIADTKLAQITTAGKVSGAALTSLASIPSGAGAIPVANIPDLSAAKITSGTLSSDRLDTGTTANKILKLDGDAKIPAVDGSLLTNIKPSDLAISSQARGDILYFNGTNWTRLPKGTDGQYLKIGANDPAWASVGGGGYTNMQVFTSGGTWTKPAGVSSVFVKVIGGGGGSGGIKYVAPATYGATGGGGGGGYSEGIVAVSGNVTVTVGAGGTAGADSGGTGGTGGTSSFAGDSTLSATGGVGSAGRTTTGAGAGGAGGDGSGGTLNISGDAGRAGFYYAYDTTRGWYAGSGGLSGIGGATYGKGALGVESGGSGTAGIAGQGGVVIVYWSQ